MTPVVPPVASSIAQDQRFALDLRGLDNLRRAAHSNPGQALQQVSRQFEALFMGMLLKSMRDATPSTGLLEGQGGKIYLSMLDQQLAQQLSGRGLKLGDAMFAQLRRASAPQAAVPADGVAGSLAQGSAPPSGTVRPNAAAHAPEDVMAKAASAPGLVGAVAISEPSGSDSPTNLAAASADSTAVFATPVRPPMANATSLPATLPRSAAVPLRAAGVPVTGAPNTGSSRLQNRVQDFLSKLGNSAREAAEATGIPETLIVAQAALESAWGRREVRADDGARTFNVFGIKADRSWGGPVTEATTTEVVDGVAQRVRAKFRSYRSYQEAFTDYAKFLTTNPRYGAVVTQKDPTRAAHALQRAGYATDPDYASKLVRVMKRLLD